MNQVNMLSSARENVERMGRRRVWNIVKSAALVLLVAPGVHANAAAAYIFTSPSSWKMENYVGQQVAVWNTGSTCTGLLTFAGSATAGDINRFWATVAIAKTSGRKIFVRYEDSAGGACPILSFGFDSE